MQLTQEKFHSGETINKLELDKGYIRLNRTQGEGIVLLLDDDDLQKLYFTLKEKICQ